MPLEGDELEEAMNRVWATLPQPLTLPVYNMEGSKVGERFDIPDFYSVFTRESHPEIMRGLQGKVIAIIDGTRIRVGNNLEELRDLLDDLQVQIHLVNGIPAVPLTLEELEGGTAE